MSIKQIPKNFAPATKGITLYTLGTPNGVKIPMALSILKVPYKVVKIDITKNVQKESWYEDNINPNGRIPALLDIDENTGDVTNVWESGAILQYIADKYDTENKISYSKERDYKNYLLQQEWLFYQNSGIGPMQGQANHFKLFAPEKIEYAAKRFVDETKRLYAIFAKQLEKNNTGYIVGDHISIADITSFGWISSAYALGLDLEQEFPAIYKWCKRILETPGSVEGLNASGKWRGFTDGPWTEPK